jgi:hypothetical protein
MGITGKACDAALSGKLSQSLLCHVAHILRKHQVFGKEIAGNSLETLHKSA